MRIGYSTLRQGWTLFVVPEARRVRNPSFADDQLCTWGHVLPLPGFTGLALQCNHHAKRILIKADMKLVLVDPVDDSDDAPPEELSAPDPTVKERPKETV